MEEFDSEAFNIDVAPAEVFQEQVRIGNLRFGKMVVEYAYRTQTIDEVMEDGAEMVIVREYIEKLIEVIYLIDNTQSVIYLQGTASIN
jgi:hypothetical protein